MEPRSPTLQADSLPAEPPGKPMCVCPCCGPFSDVAQGISAPGRPAVQRRHRSPPAGGSRCRTPTEEPDVRSRDLRSCPSSHGGLCSSSRTELWAAGPHTGGPGPLLAPAPGLLVDLPTGSWGLHGSSSPFLSSPLAISQFFSPHAENKSSLQFSFPLLL